MKSKNDLVSIIVPVYNSEKFINDTIRTVQEQTYGNWELILVNDCSTDNSVSIIEKYVKEDNRIKLINLECNSGAAIARNTGIEQATGRYIAFLDADDLWHKEKLEKQIKFMKKNEYEFTFTGYEFADENGKGNGKIVKVPEKINYKQALKNTTISTITVMFDTYSINKKLIYMPNVRSEDTATWWQVLKNGYTAFGLNEILSYYRRYHDSKSANKLIAIKQVWELYRKVEKLNLFCSIYNFCFYAINAVRRRI